MEWEKDRTADGGRLPAENILQGSQTIRPPFPSDHPFPLAELLQTLPLAFLYTAALAVFALLSDRARGAEIVIAIAGSFAGWEILSEVSAALGDLGTYRRAYRGVTPFPRFLFWSLMGAMASAPWYVMY